MALPDDPADASSPTTSGTVTAGGAPIYGAGDIVAAQEQSKWCWAASLQMIRRHVRLEERPQCAIAAVRLGRACCTEPGPCNRPLPLDQITELLNENGLRSTRAGARLTADQLWAELYAKRPVLLADVYPMRGEGHVRVAFGWQRARRGLLVRIADPAEAKRSSTTFEEMQASDWHDTWYGIEVRDGAV